MEYQSAVWAWFEQATWYKPEIGMESQVEVPGRDTLLMEYAYGSHHESMRLWSDQQQLIQELELIQILEMQGSWEEGEMGS